MQTLAVVLLFENEKPLKYFSLPFALFAKLLLLLLVLPHTSVAYAASTGVFTVPLNRYFPQTWGTQDGLPHNTINALAQTQDGYLWAGTWEGLARYNGVEFDVFTRGEKTGLPDSGIRSLFYHSDSQELLVAGSRGGLSVFNQQQWNAQKTASSMINHGFKSSDNTVWLAIEDGGLEVRFPDGTDAQFLSNTSAYRVIEDRQKRIWIATNAGLYVYKNHDVELAAPNVSALSGPSFTFALNQDGDVLVGTEQGVWQHSAEGFSMLHPALARESISSILLDSQNSIWVGTINHGLYRLSGFGLEKLDANVGLPDNRIFSLLEDAEKSIWVGTNGGLFALRRAPFTTFTQSQGLSGDYIRTVMQHNETILVGSSNGLDVLKDGRFTSISSPLKRPTSVLSLAKYADNAVLVGTYTDGVMMFKDEKLTPFLNRAGGLPSNEVRAILHAKDDSVWFGTAHGLVRMLPDGSLEQFDESRGLPAHFTMGLAEDKLGRVWVATGVGVAYIENNQVYNIKFPESSDAQYAFSFLADNDGLWMATDRGVAFFDYASKSVTLAGRAQGLPVDKVFAIQFDKKARAWISSNQGVFLISRQNLQACMEDPSKQLQFEQFKEADGLQSMQMNGGSQPSLFISDEDSIWLATAKGLANIQPQSLERINGFNIPVNIEQVSLDGRVISLLQSKNPIEVSPNIDRITFEYAGLGFAMPSRIEYQTKLVGFNQNWLTRDQVRLAEYTNLAPGNYIFKVRARYPNGQWQESRMPISFVVQPKFTQTVVFKLGVFVIICLSILVLFRLRFHHLRKSEALLRERVLAQTESLEMQTRQFEYQATHDGLTGIANRRAFDARVVELFVQAKNKKQPLCLAIIDIDHFKQVNDQYSHLIGDNVIKEVAALIEKALPVDAVCARWGGEEFTVLMPNFDLATANKCIDTLRLSIKNHDFSWIADNLSVTVSAGVASIEFASDHDRLLNQADQALYQAKQQGRDRVIDYSF